MKKIIPIGESRTILGQGEYFYIASATGKLLVIIESVDGKHSSHDVNSRFQLRVPGGIRSAELVNTNTAINTVDVETGVGEFIPSGDGQKVVLTAQDVTLQVEGKPGGVPMPVTGPLTDVELRAAPVPVSGPLTDVELRATPVNVVPVMSGTATPGGVITGSGIIVANPARKYLVVKALKANAGIGWTGAVNTGDAIEAGERVTYETTAALTLTATVPGDKFAYLEIEA